jgi:carboxypeptidase family protein
MRARTALLAAGLAIALVLGGSQPVLAQGVGAIGGIVVDESGAVLPGATVTLSSPGTIGGNQTVVSDAQGAYQFTRLVPGRYSVKAELQGFRTTTQENIDVNADRTSRADLRLLIGAVEEGITVKGEAPLLDTTSALNQTVMTRAVLDTLPTANDIWSIARLAPSVQLSKFDVGGTQMLAQSVAYVHGSLNTENGYMIDGMDINSYSGGTGSSINYYVDSFSAQEMNYQMGQTPAERQTGGVIINMITKTGTNTRRGTAMFQGTNSSLQSNNVSGSLRTQLLNGVPAIALQVNPNLNPGGDIKHLFELGGTYGGPVVKDRVWYMATAKLGEVYQYQLGSYNPDGTQLLNDNRLINTLGKLSAALTRNSQLHFTDAFVEKGRYHQAGGPQVTQFFEARAAFYNPSRNHVVIGRYTQVLSSKMVFDAAASSVRGQTDRMPEPEVQHGDVPRFDSVTRVNTVAMPTYNYDHGRRANVNTSLSYVAGSHDLKAGYQFIRTTSVAGGFSVSNYPAGFRAVYRNGVPDSVNTYNTPAIYTRYLNEHAAFIQDKWTPFQKLTLNAGLRFETAYGWIASGDMETADRGQQLCQTQTLFIQGQCFPAVDAAPDFKSLAPRLSAIYDLRGDGRTALKLSANRYTVPSGVGFADRINPIKVTSDTRPWTVCAPGQTSGCDLNGDLVPQINEFGPSTGFSLGTTNRYDPNIKPAYVSEIAAEFEQQLPGPIVVSAGYFYRGHRNTIGSVNLAVPTAGYIPLQVIETVSGRQVTVYNQDPNTRAKFDTLWSNMSQLDDSFHGVDVTLQKRMSSRWMLLGSLSVSKTDTDIYGATADLNNPNYTYRRGPASNDRPVFLKLSGAYELPYGMSVAASGQYFQGWPDTNTVLVTSSTTRLTQVSQSIVVEPSGTTRLPNVTSIDLNIRKTIGRGTWRLEPRMDIFNLFNAAAVTQRITQFGPAYGNAVEIIGGRLLKFGANVSF